MVRRNPTWVLYDSTKSMDALDGEILIIGKEDGLQRLSVSKTWICDGTFKHCPRLFMQMVSLQTKKKKNPKD